MPSIRARRSDDRPDVAAPQTLVLVRNLSVEFRSGDTQHVAVKGIDFAIGKGETVALVGESGSGKTVSALSIMRLLPYPAAHHPTGEIFFEGKDLLKTPDRVMRDIRGGRISIIFQEPMTSLNPLHTIEQQVGEILRLHKGLTEADAHVTRARPAAQGRHPRAGEAARRVSSPALRRSAPARDDRDGPGQRARSADRRRADDGARRDDPGADPRAAEEPAARVRHGDAADHARSWHRAEDGGPRLRDECRRDRRAGRSRADLLGARSTAIPAT